MHVRLRVFCAHMSDSDMAKLNRAAQKAKHGTGGYRSHTERYRLDDQYRARMEGLTPPTPEFLVFRSGEAARVEGADGSEFPY